MKNTIAEQRKVEVIPGFSPRQVSVSEPTAANSVSESDEPDTHSPDAKLERPIVQRRTMQTPRNDISVQDGIVSFGK
jgi:hypothetical protein